MHIFKRDLGSTILRLSNLLEAWARDMKVEDIGNQGIDSIKLK